MDQTRQLMEAPGQAEALTGGQIACLLAYMIAMAMWAVAEYHAWVDRSQPSRPGKAAGAPKSTATIEDGEKAPLSPKDVAAPKTASPHQRAAKAKTDDVPGANHAANNIEWGEVAEEQVTRSVLNEFFSCGLFRNLMLDKASLLESRQYLRATVEFGTIMKWFYLADRTAMLPVGTKSYSRDTFFFIFLVLVIYSFSAWKREFKAPVLLNRTQTEEWKGWMQVLFLMYHYFEAKELYNGIRVLIAGYVWMTGFGNYIYYYKTRDFSIGRFAEMMWRLNFLVLFCCLVLNNSYMLYYICPMHTFFTVCVYAVLAFCPKLNDSKAWLLGKIVFSLAAMHLLYANEAVFAAIWRPFGGLFTYVDPRRPSDDDMHEWFFRSGLDRYVWVYGMLCGFLHPYVDALATSVDNMSAAAKYIIKAAAVAVCLVVGTVWYQNVYSLPKYEYNALHPYTSWIPITIWSVLRNLTPRMRVVSLGVFGWCGCITLETYMSQFHTWLSSSIPDGQPVGLLVLIPNYPLLNFALVTTVYVFLSYRLFQLTNTLKNAAVPGRDAFKVGINAAVMTISFLALLAVGSILSTHSRVVLTALA